MSALDFKEIPRANTGDGRQDTFELFARDFLLYLGYQIDVHPSRGADGGKDIIVIENRTGISGTTQIRWLVSCKHNAHSNSSVKPKDEENLNNRLHSNECNGFIGFYSSVPSSGLATILTNLKRQFEVQQFDHNLIEGHLLKSVEGLQLAKQYFPESLKKWTDENPSPALVFDSETTLNCEHCGKNLLTPEPTGIIVYWHSMTAERKQRHIKNIYWCCKGSCEQHLKAANYERGYIDAWEDIADLKIPVIFIKRVMMAINQLYAGEKFSEIAFEKLKDVLLNVFPYAARNQTSTESNRIDSLLGLPAYLGGLGK